jgi:hypothetical protein
VALVEVTVSAGTSQPTGAGTDPWNDTWAVPSGTDRMCIVFDCAIQQTITSVVVDPAGVNQALSGLDHAGPASGGLTDVWDSNLLEAVMPAAGNYTFRTDWNAAVDGYREFVAVTGAEQTIYRNEGFNASGTVLTVSVTHPTSVFPAGSFVYGAYTDGDGFSANTVTGNATNVRDVGGSQFSERFVFAKGTLGSDTATVSVTFTKAGAAERQAAIVRVIAPVVDAGRKFILTKPA